MANNRKLLKYLIIYKISKNKPCKKFGPKLGAIDYVNIQYIKQNKFGMIGQG